MFDDHVLRQLRERNPHFHDTVYVFVMSALQYALDRLDEPRHISGDELAQAARDLARDRFGPMARTVLEYWGIHSTADLGAVVFALVDCGVLLKQDHDTLDDFEDIYDFEEAFDRDYPWGASL